MVLPAPAVDAAPAARAWLERLSVILRLSEGGVIVLIDRARPERLGELTRHLLRERPDAEVLMEAPALAAVPAGSAVILCARASHAEWLNEERPLVQARALRLVLFSDEDTTVQLARRAVDFYDWISHRIDCPPGPPGFAVRALRRAAKERAPVVVWGGGDLEASFALALPGRRLERVSGRAPYGAVVEALRPKAKTWVALGDLDGPMPVRRMQWAAAEAGRRGRLLLVEPVGAASWMPKAEARVLSIEEGVRRLREAGIQQAARLAAALELKPSAIEVAARLARAGVSEAELFEAALQHEEPSAARMRLEQAHGAPGEWTEDEQPERGDFRRFILPDWPARIEMALAAGDLEVADHWATGWRAATSGGVRATAALARVRAQEGRRVEARALLEEARARATSDDDERTRFELNRAEGFVLLVEGEAQGASSPLKEALRIGLRIGIERDERDELYDALVPSLASAGNIREAARTLAEWKRTLRAEGSGAHDSDVVRAETELMLARGDTRVAAELLEELLTHWDAPDHPNREKLEQLLGQAWIEQGRNRDAERLLRGAIERVERLGRRSAYLRHEHARTLLSLGRFEEAEHELRSVLADTEGTTRNAIATRHELARCLAAQGKTDDAEALLDANLEELRRNDLTRTQHYTNSLYEKARICLLRDDLDAALDLSYQVLRLEESVWGREHPTLIMTLGQIATTLLKLGRPKDAEPILRRAVHLAETSGNSLHLASTLADLATVQAAQGFAHARSTASRALAAWQSAGSEPPPVVLRALEAIARGAAPPPLPGRR